MKQIIHAVELAALAQVSSNPVVSIEQYTPSQDKKCDALLSVHLDHSDACAESRFRPRGLCLDCEVL